MSKQNDAKVAQRYEEKGRNCGNCKLRKFDLELPAWMRADNRYIGKPEYLQEKNQRCMEGGFAIKKTATCRLWAAK